MSEVPLKKKSEELCEVKQNLLERMLQWFGMVSSTPVVGLTKPSC